MFETAIGDRRSWKLLALAVGATIACTLAMAMAAPAKAAPGQLYITLGFDDGHRSQYEHRDVLAARGVKATYYVNSNWISSPLHPAYMTWEQLHDLAQAGNEIGGHTLDHVDLRTVDETEMRRQVCDDRKAFVDHDFAPTSFAYPHGGWTPLARQVVQECDYDTGRTTGGFRDDPFEDCFGDCAETVPPANAYSVRAWQTQGTVTLDAYKELITKARNDDGDWLPLVFHELCASTQCATAGPYAVNTQVLGELLDWIAKDSRLKIRTTAQVVGIPDDTTAPVVGLTSPAADTQVVPGQGLSLAASASDNLEVNRVEFLVDGQIVGTDTQAPFAFAWVAPSAAGGRTLTARAYDDAGNSTTSAPRVVTVPATTRSIAKPSSTAAALRAQIARFKKTGNRRWSLTVTVKDPSVGARMEVLLDGRVIRTSTRLLSRRAFSLRLPLGRHTIAVRTIGVDGRRYKSAERKVHVKAAKKKKSSKK